MELFERLSQAPIISPSDVTPSRANLVVRCVINPGAFAYQGRIGLLLRVCEHPPQEEGWITAVIRDDQSADGLKTVRFRKGDPALRGGDPRVFKYDGVAYLTTLSHLRLAWSDDGVHFRIDPKPAVEGLGRYERYGVEDVRVTSLEGEFHLTFTGVSELGVAVAHAVTRDFKHFERHGLILPPHNKTCALFPARCSDRYMLIHRPSGVGIGGHYMWMASSPDMDDWGHHRILATTRKDWWDGERVGVNGPPILTDRGWLVLYHGADMQIRYSFGALLLDRDDPGRVLARSTDPIMTPQLDFEKRGFFPNVVYSNGHILRGDELTIYYGAADEYIGAARCSVKAILESIGPVT
jgi:predicted GH43/DUF377 family glycosyl hydrolase